MTQVLSLCLDRPDVPLQPSAVIESLQMDMSNVSLERSDALDQHPVSTNIPVSALADKTPAPSKDPSAPVTNGAERLNTEPAPIPPNFLLVDDNPINLSLLTTFMKRNTYMYTTATNGREAVDAFQASPKRFDYVLMDISMPIMDGLTATRLIRAYEKEEGREIGGVWKPTVVVALTGLASEEARNEAFTSGVNQFLVKPVRLKDVKDLVE